MNDDIPKRWVGGICIKDNKVLLIHRINKERILHQEYFIFPGKTVDDNESLETALLEEFNNLSMTVSLKDLLHSKENEGDESEYYYLCDVLLGEPVIKQTAEGSDVEKKGQQFYTPMWVPLNELDELMIHPETVKAKLIDILL